MEEKLQKNTDFRKVYETKRSYVHPLLVLYIRPNNLGKNRWGFSIGKKTFGKAVVRNRVKRILREISRLNRHQVKSGYDLVFVGRKALLEKEYAEIEKAMRKLLCKADLWKESEDRNEKRGPSDH